MEIFYYFDKPLFLRLNPYTLYFIEKSIFYAFLQTWTSLQERPT